MRHSFKGFRHFLLYIVLINFYRLCRILPFRWVSAIGGSLGKLLYYFGPKKKARDNLRYAFADISCTEIKQIIYRMYENFGRTLAEFTHLDLLTPKTKGLTVDIQGIEILQNLKQQGQAALLFSAHYGNWEIGPIATGWNGVKLTPVFKESTNPYLNRFLLNMRQRTSDGVIAVGQRAGYELLRHLKKGNHIVMLTDQRVSKGIRVPFFNRPAKTGPGIAKLALAAQCPMIPTIVERVEKTHFKVHIFPPLIFNPDAEDAEHEILINMNQFFEQWIRQRPDNWWWEYHRWS
ncbi:lysophospholipid acyltransferase family protein [Legionella sp.]|uniref:lysophospholipid acyltransferase family protein n=1 Tax=Legionella sp. TaxID=459 RepID=UPI00321FA6D7